MYWRGKGFRTGALLLAGAWLAALVLVWIQWPSWFQVFSPGVLQSYLLRWGFWQGAGIFLLIYVATIRPLVPIPARLLAIVAGVVFGPWWGTALAVLAGTLNACILFVIGKFLARTLIEEYLGP